MTLSVSVALCTYNGARFIGEQIASILDQELLPAELVVSDDGSTDDTLARIRSLVRDRGEPVRLRILPAGPHRGVTLNFQRAVEACRGDLIALSDQDDVWHTDRLSTTVPDFEHDPGLLLLHGDARLVDQEGRAFGAGLFASLGVSQHERSAIRGGEAFGVFIRRNLATGATTMFRRTLLDSALPFPADWVHDEWLAIIAAALDGVSVVDAQLIDYRQHDSNEIGVADRTLGYRVGKLLEPRTDRLQKLATRSEILSRRIGLLPVAPRHIELAERKLAFERIRESLATKRPRRVAAVLRLARGRSYQTLSSQGSLDILRDLVQPA